jgi:hypothetical protein
MVNTDGTALTDIQGYFVEYGQSASLLSQGITVTGASTNSLTVSGLSVGTYYFAVRTVSTIGGLSERSAVVSGTVP